MKLRKIFEFTFLVLVLVVVSGLIYLWKDEKTDFLNPKGTSSSLLTSSLDNGVFRVIGFLPTYMLGKTIEYTDEVSELVFLGVEIDERGNLVWDTQSNKVNSEIYLRQKEFIWHNGGKNILGIKLFEDEKIDELIGSDDAENNLIRQIKELGMTNKFDGINLDIEYQSNSRGVLDERFLAFLKKMKESGVGEISLDVLVNTINKGTQEEIGNLLDGVDELIIMAYDFHRPGMNFSGVVAPIMAESGDRSIMETVEEILKMDVDRNKIVMAFPLYGYEWKTYKSEFGSQVIGNWSQMVSYRRAKEIVETAGVDDLVVNWDEQSMTPWLSFKENGEIHEIYYEDDKSLKIKLALVRQNGFGGVGFWALGYEGVDETFWNLIDK